MQIVSTGKCTNHRLTQATIGHCRWEWVLIIFKSLVWLLLVTLVWCCTPSLFYLGGQTEIQMINTEIIQWRANHLSLDPGDHFTLQAPTKAFTNMNQTAIYNVPALEDHIENHCCWGKEQSLVCVCVPHVRSENSPAGSDKVCLS